MGLRNETRRVIMFDRDTTLGEVMEAEKCTQFFDEDEAASKKITSA